MEHSTKFRLMDKQVIQMKGERGIMRALFVIPLLVLFAVLASATTQTTVNAETNATIQVTTTADEYDTSGTGMGCSLREAVEAANKDKPFGGCLAGSGEDTIVLGAELYMLERAGDDNKNKMGDLDVKKPLVIQGAGYTTTTIDGNKLDRVIDAFGKLTLSGVTIQNGAAGGSGGGILSRDSLNVQSSRIRNNETGGAGGAIANESDKEGLQVTIHESIVLNNRAGGSGGGVFSLPKLVITNSTFDLNQTSGGQYSYGGGLYSTTQMEMRNSTVSFNTAWEGGGIYNTAQTVIINSTIVGNFAQTDGGGIRNYIEGHIKLYSTTIVYNTADADSNGTGFGGGISSPTCVNNCRVVEMANTLLGGNTRKSVGAVLDDTAGYFELLGYNLIQAPGGQFVGDTTNVLLGIAPKLSGVGNNGGSTYTVALLSDSPAMDAGNPNGCKDENGKLLKYDQRGEARIMDGWGQTGPRCDVGAYEAPLSSTCTGKPNKPQLDKPLAGEGVDRAKVKLDWFNTRCAATYAVEVRRDSKTGPVEFTKDGLVLSKTKTKALPIDVQYYWRVKACNENGCSKSKWRMFGRGNN